MSHDLEIARVTADRLEELLELCREHAAYEQAQFREDGQIERWRSALFGPAPALNAWMALDDGRPAGFMTVTTDFATWSARRFAYMDCLYLRESYRGRGVGRLFLDQLQQFARGERCEWVEWQTPVNNELGIGFYEHLGARSKVKLRFTFELTGHEATC